MIRFKEFQRYDEAEAIVVNIKRICSKSNKFFLNLLRHFGLKKHILKLWDNRTSIKNLTLHLASSTISRDLVLEMPNIPGVCTIKLYREFYGKIYGEILIS